MMNMLSSLPCHEYNLQIQMFISQQFQQLIKLSPDVGHEKYMYLGQMCGGADAANYFNKGIEILKAEVSSLSDTL